MSRRSDAAIVLASVAFAAFSLVTSCKVPPPKPTDPAVSAAAVWKHEAEHLVPQAPHEVRIGHATAATTPDRPVSAATASARSRLGAHSAREGVSAGSFSAEEWSPPSLGLVLEYAAAYFPEQPGKAQRVTACEMGADLDTGAYDADAVFTLDGIHGGPMQIAQAVWLPYFGDRYGVTWAQLVRDLEMHFAAARTIYLRAGSWAPWPVCGLR